MNLKLKNLYKNYEDKNAVDNINFEFHNGVYGLLGANGAGKSTLLKMICGVLRPTKGFILADSNNIETIQSKYLSSIGYLPQNFGYYPGFTAYDYLHYIALINGIPKMKLISQIEQCLHTVNLYEVRNKKIKSFSGGMLRRLGIAQAIIKEPSLLVLDEPTTGLDPKERNKFRKLLSSLSKNRIVLISTHIVSDIESIANTVILMKAGKFLSTGSVSELLAPISEYVWECTANQSDSDNLQNHYLVTNIKSGMEADTLRIVSKTKPHRNAYNITPDLEDLYMFYFGMEVLES